jgi:hypothetical protein
MGPIADTHRTYNRTKNRCEFLGITCSLPPFAEFLHTLGTRPARHILTRIDEKGIFEIGNVRWTLDERLPIKEFKQPLCPACQTPLVSGACPTPGPDCNAWKKTQWQLPKGTKTPRPCDQPRKDWPDGWDHLAPVAHKAATARPSSGTTVDAQPFISEKTTPAEIAMRAARMAKRFSPARMGGMVKP